MNYFNEEGGIHPFGENQILFRSYYEHLLYLYNNSSDFNNISIRPNVLQELQSLIKKYQIGPNEFKVSDHEGWSHDNDLALRTLSSLYHFQYHNSIVTKGWFSQRAQPWNIIFNGLLAGGWRKAISMPFIWILSLHMIVSCYRSDTSDNGIFRTSGKLLAWLRLNSPDINMPMTKRICDKLADRHGSWYNMFYIYFNKDVNHPIVELARRLYL